MTIEKWELQKKSLEDLFRVEGLDQIEVYYDLEETRAFDPTIVALAVVTLVITKMAEHLIKDLYDILKGKFKKIFDSRKHASKLSFEITIAVKTGNSAILIQDNVKNDVEIDQLMEMVRSVCEKLDKHSDMGFNRISNDELNKRLSQLSQIEVEN